jgi:hypothetical protein
MVPVRKGSVRKGSVRKGSVRKVPVLTGSCSGVRRHKISCTMLCLIV